MTNTQILNTINSEIRSLTRAFEQHKVGQPTDIRHEWMNNVEVSHALGVSTRTLNRLRSCGALPYSRVHGKIYFKRSDVEQLLENNYHKIDRFCSCR